MSSSKEEMVPEVEKVEVDSESSDEEESDEKLTKTDVEIRIIKYQLIGGAFIFASLIGATVTSFNPGFPLEVSFGLFGIGAVILAYFGYLTFKIDPEDYADDEK